MTNQISERLAEMPAVAILRGVTEDQILAVADVILAAGIGIIEVPLNSPNAINSIKILCAERRGQGVFGCGTCTDLKSLEQVASAGAELVVTPNVDPAIIRAAIAHDMTPMPGCMTPSEAFSAYHAGARYLKLFPAASVGLAHYQAMQAVLPTDINVLAVGGVGADSAAQWIDAGMCGIGVGSELFKPGRSIDDIAKRAKQIAKSLTER